VGRRGYLFHCLLCPPLRLIYCVGPGALRSNTSLFGSPRCRVLELFCFCPDRNSPFPPECGPVLILPGVFQNTTIFCFTVNVCSLSFFLMPVRLNDRTCSCNGLLYLPCVARPLDYERCLSFFCHVVFFVSPPLRRPSHFFPKSPLFTPISAGRPNFFGDAA